MAFFDWNHDGKKDFTDDFIEYEMYKRSRNASQGNRSNNNDGCLTNFLTVLMTVGILLLFGAILQSCEPKCAYPGCDSEVSEENTYCSYHQLYRKYVK